MSIIKRDFKETWSFPENLATCYTIRRFILIPHILSLRDDGREIEKLQIGRSFLKRFEKRAGFLFWNWTFS